MTLSQILGYLTPPCIKRKRRAARRLEEATLENRRVVALTRQQLRDAKHRVERAIIAKDVRDIDVRLDRNSSE
jgi:hypothetical protein